MSGTVRVVLADDHAVVRTGYRRLLELEEGIEVVAEFGDTNDAYAWLICNDADVLVLDLSMPGRGGIETLVRLRARLPRLRVLVFSMHDNPDIVAQALGAGAGGYLTKSSQPEALVGAVRELMRGGMPLSPEVREALEQAPDDAAAAPHLALSPREFEIFLLLAAGASVEEIAGRLFVSAKTAANYQTMVRRKTKLNNALEMNRYARAHGLL